MLALMSAVALGIVFGGCSSVRARLHATVGPDGPVTAVDLRAPTANNSPLLAADGTDPRFVVAAFRRDAPDLGCGLQVSGDGGRGWLPARPVPRLPRGAEKCYAPEAAFDRAGTLYYLFVGLRGKGNNPMGVFLTSSDDRARTFRPPRLVLGPSNYQVRMAIDPTLGARGRIHLVWLHVGAPAPLGGLPPSANPILAKHSDDGGRSFSAPVPVSDGNRPRAVAPALAVGPGHTVDVLYYDLQRDVRDYEGLEGPTWNYSPWSLVAATSSDGGEHFGPGVTVNERLVPPGRVMLIYTMPPPALVADRSGALYAAWTDARNGDPDVFMARSGDGGRGWSAPLRLNDDPLHNGRDQYLPRLSLAGDGRIDAIFYDRRADGGDRYNDVSYTSSSDGGRHFSPNLRLTSEASDSQIGQRYLVPSATGLVELGSRIGLLSRAGGALAVWTDTRNTSPGLAQQDLFSAQVPSGDSGSSPSTYLAPAPAVVNVAMRDYRFDYNPAIPAGPVVFRVSNQGRLDHELLLTVLPEGFPPIDAQLHGSIRRPLGILGQLPRRRPGISGTFAVDLAPGRYAMISFVAGTDGVQDDLKGMSSEFRVR